MEEDAAEVDGEEDEINLHKKNPFWFIEEDLDYLNILNKGVLPENIQEFFMKIQDVNFIQHPIKLDYFKLSLLRLFYKDFHFIFKF